MDIEIPFSKWTVLGNHFVIIDELAETLVPEQEKSRLSKQIANAQYGIGCDDVIFVQNLSEDTTLEPLARLEEMAVGRDGMASDQPHSIDGSPLTVFRVFEPDGSEAAMCGDGLIAAAGYLRRARGVKVARFITELPRNHAKLRSTRVAVDLDAAGYTVKVEFGATERMPVDFVSPRCPRILLDPESGVERLESLCGVMKSFSSCNLDRDTKRVLEEFDTHCSAFLICAGEPHLVITPKKRAMTASNVDSLPSNLFLTPPEHRSSWIIDTLGKAVNQLERLFPRGINVCVCNFDPTGSAVMRSFERGLLRETFACGTGAVAVATVACVLERADRRRPVNVLPLLAQQDVRAFFRITGGGSARYLEGTARLVFNGVFLT